MSVIMQCGHNDYALRRFEDGSTIRCCAICDPPESETPMDPQPDLAGREAKCPDCGRRVPSSANLPFFRYRPKMAYDSYYCGCRGWD